MPTDISHANTAWCGTQPAGKGCHGRISFSPASVKALHHLEAQRAECCGDAPGGCKTARQRR